MAILNLAIVLVVRLIILAKIILRIVKIVVARRKQKDKT
jgi:hypothetical protein